jgi:ribonuclease PH
MAMQRLRKNGQLKKNPVHDQIAAVSVGIYKGTLILDLDYEEDSQAEIDMNIVMNEAGRFVEIQGTAERNTFTHEELDALLELASAGANEIIKAQNVALAKV